jgi:hypothetical protein
MLREMAETTGVSKSAVSRERIEASAGQMEALQSRTIGAWDLLVVYVDGLVFSDHHVLAAVGWMRRERSMCSASHPVPARTTTSRRISCGT